MNQNGRKTGELSETSYVIDASKEELVDVARGLPRFVHDLVGGKRIHKSTAYRWALQGVRGRRMPTVRVAGRLYTSKEAFSWWSAVLAQDLVDTDAAAGTADGGSAPRGVEETLRRAGVRD